MPEHQYRMGSGVISPDVPGLLLPSLHQQKTPKLLPSELSVQKNDLFCDIRTKCFSVLKQSFVLFFEVRDSSGNELIFQIQAFATAAQLPS